MAKVLCLCMLMFLSPILSAEVVDMMVGNIVLPNDFKDSVFSTRYSRVGKISSATYTINYSIGGQADRHTDASRKKSCQWFEETEVGDSRIYTCMTKGTNLLVVTMVSVDGSGEDFAGFPANFWIEDAHKVPFADLLQIVNTFKPLNLVKLRAQKAEAARRLKEEAEMELPEYDDLPEYAEDF